MRVVIVGSGNLATQLSLALRDAGTEIAQVFSRTLAHACELGARLGCPATDSIDGVTADADAYIVAVKDDALGTVAAALGRKSDTAVFIHTAGSVPMSVFEGCARHYGVLYPMQTFSKNRRVEFHDIPCFLEASDAHSMTVLRSLASSVSDRVMVVDSERRKRLHLAAVLACNLTNHCYRLAERVLETAGVDFSLYLPLIEETAHKVENLSPRQAQTGPMVRYDRAVMELQLGLLPDERTRQIYRLMAESIYEDSLQA